MGHRGRLNLRVDSAPPLRGARRRIPRTDGADVRARRSTARPSGRATHAGEQRPPVRRSIFPWRRWKHDTEDDCWMVVKGKVSRACEQVPTLRACTQGGNASITILNYDVDSTEDFEAVHSAKAWKQLEEYAIGYLDPKDDPNAAAANHASTAQVTLTAAPIKSEARAPATGPVNLLQYALDREMCGRCALRRRTGGSGGVRPHVGGRARGGAGTRPSRSTPRVDPAGGDAAFRGGAADDTILLRAEAGRAGAPCAARPAAHVYLRAQRASGCEKGDARAQCVPEHAGAPGVVIARTSPGRPQGLP